MQKPSFMPRARRTTISLLTLVAFSTAATRARAADSAPSSPVMSVEKLPPGTAIQRPGAAVELLYEPRWILTRPAVERLIVEDADLEACREAVKACEARATSADPKPGFFQTVPGKVAIGLAAGALVGGGFYVGEHFK